MKIRTFLVTILATLFAFGSLTFATETSKPKAIAEKPSIEAMNKRMAEMQKEMIQIRETKDSKKKQALIEDHMKNMQTQMNMMGQMMSGMMDGKGMGMMDGAMGKGKMMGKNQQHMMSQMGQMHGMMGQMMGQMQEHMNACPFAEGAKKE